jgi:hypothetical protein
LAGVVVQHVNYELLVVKDAYPAVAQRLEELWGTEDFRTYAENLIQERTRVARTGFPGNVVLAISELISIHDIQFPAFAPVQDSFWSSIY